MVLPRQEVSKICPFGWAGLKCFIKTSVRTSSSFTKSMCLWLFLNQNSRSSKNYLLLLKFLEIAVNFRMIFSNQFYKRNLRLLSCPFLTVPGTCECFQKIVFVCLADFFFLVIFRPIIIRGCQRCWPQKSRNRLIESPNCTFFLGTDMHY